MNIIKSVYIDNKTLYGPGGYRCCKPKSFRMIFKGIIRKEIKYIEVKKVKPLKEPKVLKVKEVKLSVPYIKKVKEPFHPLNIKYLTYKNRSKKKKKEFCLTISEFESILSKNCTYCNSTSEEVTMTIDRIDSKIGYTPSNVQPCCTICNTIKWSLPEEVFKKHILKIYNYYFPNIL